MYKVDFHTHSIVSHDGGITLADYDAVLSRAVLDYIAITDHGIAAGLDTSRSQFSDRIITGEEVDTQSGEVIGLYLSQSIASGLSLAATIRAIKDQGGLVYVPHPFERHRRGLSARDMERYKSEFDIVEIFNGRAWGPKAANRALAFASVNNIATASSSDAHRITGLGRAYTILAEPPTKHNLVTQLRDAGFVKRRSSMRGYLAPSLNVLRKRLIK